MKNTNFRNFINTARDELKPKPFAVTGFEFYEDTLEGETLYSDDQAKELGFWHNKAPRVAGFCYVSQEYRLWVQRQADEQC